MPIDDIQRMKQYGLFAAPLNNGSWMVGKANCIYSMNPGMDHYQDERLAIHNILAAAIDLWVEKHAKEAR